MNGVSSRVCCEQARSGPRNGGGCTDSSDGGVLPRRDTGNVFLLAPWRGGGDRKNVALSYVICVRQLRVCGSQLAVCLVSLFVSVCRSCVSSSYVLRPPIPRWCPVRAWLFFTFLPTYLPCQ